MEKYEKIEQLQKLKENGAISEKEFEAEKSKILNKQINPKIKKHLTTLICIIAVVAFIGGIQLIVNNANKSSSEYARSVVEDSLNSNTTNKYRSKIIGKWKNISSSGTTGLECAVYNIEENELYIQYSYGFCTVDKDNKIERYVNGDLMAGTIQLLVNKAKSDNNNYVYMTASEFVQLVK